VIKASVFRKVSESERCSDTAAPTSFGKRKIMPTEQAIPIKMNNMDPGVLTLGSL
jgi:hypothetical protein